MKLVNDRIKKKFDDVAEQIDFMVDYCQTLQQENEALLLKVKHVESELEKRGNTAGRLPEQETLIQAKVDGLLTKLDSFSNSVQEDCSSDL